MPTGTLLGVALAIGTLLRLRDVGPALLFGDELHTLHDIHAGLGSALTTFSDTGSGMALPLLQLAAIALFDAGHWALRAPAWIPAIATLLLVYPLARRRLGEPIALVATLLVAVNPMLVFYAHFARAYALVALLSLLLLDRLDRAVVADERGRPELLALISWTALLPWVHPTALGFVLPAFAGAIVATLRRPNGRARAAWLAAALVAGGLGCLLLHLPAWPSLIAFVEAKTTTEYYGDFGPWDVAALIVGDQTTARLLAVAIGAAAIAWLRVCGLRGLTLLAGCVGPFVAIALVRPYGDAYAYARYAMPAIVPLCVLLAFLVDRLVLRALAGPGERVAGRAAGPITAGLSLGVGAALALALFVTSPLAAWRADTAEHASTYLELFPLPAFDRPWPGTPAFYREIAARPRDERRALRIIEAPALTTRARHLYRHYQLQHGARTMLAPFPGEFPRIPSGPYVALASPDWREQSGADYLVVHRRIADEVMRYWRWVYKPPTPFDAEHVAYMERHARFGGALPKPPPGWLPQLRAQLGDPVYEDDDIIVFDLAQGAPTPGDPSAP